MSYSRNGSCGVCRGMLRGGIFRNSCRPPLSSAYGASLQAVPRRPAITLYFIIPLRGPNAELALFSEPLG